MEIQENEVLELGKDLVYNDYVKLIYFDGSSSFLKINEHNESQIYNGEIEPIFIDYNVITATNEFIHIFGENGWEENEEDWFVYPLEFESEYIIDGYIPCLYVIISKCSEDGYGFLRAGFGEFKKRKNSGVVGLNETFPFQGDFGQYLHEIQHALRLYKKELNIDIDKLRYNSKRY